MFRLILSYPFFQWISIYVYIFSSGQCRRVHVIDSISSCFLLQHPWLEVHCLEAAKSIDDWSQEGDITAWGTETLLGLHRLLKQWVESGLNHHLKLKILMNEWGDSTRLPPCLCCTPQCLYWALKGSVKQILWERHRFQSANLRKIQACLKRAEICPRLMACSGGKRNWIN